MTNQNLITKLPKVDKVLAEPIISTALAKIPHTLVLKGIRAVIEDLRKKLLSNQLLETTILTPAAVASSAISLTHKLTNPSLRRLINGTGVIIHTNLGRSLLAKTALQRLIENSKVYTNLEYDLNKGSRGNRHSHIINILKEITGAESAIIVNNNAAAVYLCLQSLAVGREVIVSRGQLIEIGGHFRIPDIMTRSGAILKEIGSTNKTHLEDYEQAINIKTSLLLKVHTSNFALVGFHQEVPLKKLRQLANYYHLPLMVNLGSGVLINLTNFGLPNEPTVQETLANGADIVTFSGDKLLGGPQAGIILGRTKLIEQIRINPLNRILRIDKLTLAAIEATLELYRDPKQAITKIPTLHMLSKSYKKLRRQAANLTKQLIALGLPKLKAITRDGQSQVGGGALPLAAPRTRLVQIRIKGISSTKLEQALRTAPIPIIPRIENGQVLIDVRTLLNNDLQLIVKTIAKIAN